MLVEVDTEEIPLIVHDELGEKCPEGFHCHLAASEWIFLPDEPGLRKFLRFWLHHGTSKRPHEGIWGSWIEVMVKDPETEKGYKQDGAGEKKTAEASDR